MRFRPLAACAAALLVAGACADPFAPPVVGAPTGARAAAAGLVGARSTDVAAAASPATLTPRFAAGKCLDVLGASRELRRIHPRLVETADGLELVWS